VSSSCPRCRFDVRRDLPLIRSTSEPRGSSLAGGMLRCSVGNGGVSLRACREPAGTGSVRVSGSSCRSRGRACGFQVPLRTLVETAVTKTSWVHNQGVFCRIRGRNLGSGCSHGCSHGMGSVFPWVFPRTLGWRRSPRWERCPEGDRRPGADAWGGELVALPCCRPACFSSPRAGASVGVRRGRPTRRRFLRARPPGRGSPVSSPRASWSWERRRRFRACLRARRSAGAGRPPRWCTR
jgi:hypothetical protein